MRDTGLLLTLDTIESVVAFKSKGHKIVLFSYQWLSWSRNGPNTLQHNAMKNSLQALARANQVSMERMHIWLDILSIPQCHPELKRLAVYSLYVYAGLSDYLVIVAPKCHHDDTKEVADEQSYKSRVWCRAEQLAHFCKAGMDNMFLCVEETGALRGLEPQWIRSVCRVFDGDMTCCRMLHDRDGVQIKCDRESLVLTLIGLYFEVFTAYLTDDVRPETMDMQKLIQEEKGLIFPAKFEYVTKKKGTETRELFGDTIQRVERIVRKDVAKAQKRCWVSGSGKLNGTMALDIAEAAPADVLLGVGSVGSRLTSSAEMLDFVGRPSLHAPVLLGSDGAFGSEKLSECKSFAV